MSKPLQGKTALVTGAGRSIGRSIAQRLAASGALVAINYASNSDAAHETLASIENAGGSGFLLQANLGPPEVAETLAAELATELTKRTGSPDLDILVNNAGGSRAANIAQTTPEIYREMFARNADTMFFVTRAVLPRLRQGARVINISSAGARLALTGFIAYCMSKAAMDVFTRALAKELGPRGITVNTVAPGYTATDALAPTMAKSEVMEYANAMTALGRGFAKPEEIAEVVHFLATPGSSWVTGQIIEASGGFCM